MSGDDIPGGLHLCRACGWNQLAEDWHVFLRAGNGAFVLEEDGRILGTVAYIHYGSLAWIAMMLVDPAERRKGCGARLMETVLEALRDAPCVGLDATPAGEPLYIRFGFEASYSLVRMRATAGAVAGGEARPMQASDLAEVVRRDREVFGGDRGRLLTSLHERAPETAWIARRAYAFGRPGARYHQVGPVVADDLVSATAVTAAALSTLDGKPVVVDASPLVDGWIDWLQSAGFSEERPFVRMFRKGDVYSGQRDLQYAIAGPEFA